MRALLIDDEIAAREVLENLILRFAPDLTIVGQASNLLSGIDLIRKHKPNVVFLDVQMPNYYVYEISKFFDQIDPYFQPMELKFTDVMTGDIGHISVDKIEYNIGLPSFLFDISGEID